MKKQTAVRTAVFLRTFRCFLAPVFSYRKIRKKEMYMETRIAVTAIIVEDRPKTGELNRSLHVYGEYSV